MKQYYLERLHWIFNYTSKNFFYCLAKTLCIIIGLPIYAVMFVVEMVLTAVNMIFSWIPILNLFIMVVCKSIIFLVEKTFYICILTDIKKYQSAMREDVEYEVSDTTDSGEQTQEAIAEASPDVVNNEPESAQTEEAVQETASKRKTSKIK